MWRSIFKAHELFRFGVRRRIGDGSNINILLDHWIIGGDSLIVKSRHPALVDRTVSSLLQMDKKDWDMDIVKDLFINDEVELILSIPLSVSNSQDPWLWLKEVSGVYFVKSAYRSLDEAHVV